MDPDVEDAAERDARMRRLKEEEEKMHLAKRSLVVQRLLPRPATVNADAFLQRLESVDREDDPVYHDVGRLIHTEMGRLASHDSIAYPLPGTSQIGGSQAEHEFFPDDDCALSQNGVPGEVSWTSLQRGLLYDISSHLWVVPGSLSLQAHVAGYDSLLADRRRND